uniref:Clathrin_bdg domain-containing protein n=1 Tax=Elaeophora elaphi TaxID=1147741 RepID=A0A0R3RXX8_9BILA
MNQTVDVIDWSESDADTYDDENEGTPSSSDDEFLHVDNHDNDWDENDAVDSNKFMQQLIVDSERQNLHGGSGNMQIASGMAPKKSADTDVGATADVMDWTTTSDDDTTDDTTALQLAISAIIPTDTTILFDTFENAFLTDRIIVSPRRNTSMNSLHNFRFQQSHEYFHPSFPDRRWSFSHLP